MTITTFDRATCRQLGQDLERVLQQFAAERGVKVERAGGTFDGASFTAKLKFSVTGAAASDAARDEFDAVCGAFGLTPAHRGAMFTWGNRRLRLVGFKAGSPKFPLLAEEPATGKRFKLTEDALPKIREASARAA